MIFVELISPTLGLTSNCPPNNLAPKINLRVLPIPKAAAVADAEMALDEPA
jgi:hypothetical protein